MGGFIELTVLSLAVFRVSRLVVDDSITDPLRQRVTQPFLSELIACVWCTSFWVGLAATIGYWYAPGLSFWVALPFALSALAGILDAIS